MSGHTFIGEEPDREAAQSFIDLIYETADGFMSVAVTRRKDWEALAAAVERPDWLEDPRFQDAAGLERHKNARLEMTQEALRGRTTAEWMERLEATDVPCAPVLTRREMIRHPQIAANGLLLETEHAAGRSDPPDADAGAVLRHAGRAPRRRAAPRRPDPRDPGRDRAVGSGDRGDAGERRGDRAGGEPRDPVPLRADAERLEGRDHAGGMRVALRDASDAARSGRPVQAGVPRRSARTRRCRRSSTTIRPRPMAPSR